jgi:hypothetical protein
VLRTCAMPRHDVMNSTTPSPSLSQVPQGVCPASQEGAAGLGYQLLGACGLDARSVREAEWKVAPSTRGPAPGNPTWFAPSCAARSVLLCLSLW